MDPLKGILVYDLGKGFLHPDRDEQYDWLKERTDPASGLEIPFLDFLYEGVYRLPDAAQNRPCPDVASQPDFYYEREGVPGACIFVDGSDHLDPVWKERDTAARTALEAHGQAQQSRVEITT